MRLRYLGVLSLFAASTLIARADITGSTVDVQYLYPNTSTVTYDSGAQVVTPGLTDVDSGDGVTISFTANTITITNDEDLAFNSSSFNGVGISFLSGPTIDGVTIDPSSTPEFADGAGLSFTGSDIMLNLQNQCNGDGSDCAVGDQIVLDVTAASTPEPSSLALLGTTILGAAGALRKRLA